MIIQTGKYMMLVNTRRGLFAISQHDQIMAYALHQHGEFAEDELELIAQHLKPGDTAVDVGANVGVHTVAMSKMVGDSGMVYAFEPVLATYGMLSGNVAINECENVFVQRAVVTDTNGLTHLPNISPGKPGNFGSFCALEHAGDKGIPTPMTTIDALSIDKCAVMKIDVEGSEMSVLRGARETLLRCKPFIIAECNDGKDEQQREMIAFFQSVGYSTEMMFNRLYRPDNYRRCENAVDGHDRNMVATPNQGAE